jgi:hypothetical protein
MIMSGSNSLASSSAAILLLMIGALCLGVLLQMLGVSVTFWNLNGSDDLLSTSILTGFAVLPDNSELAPRLLAMFTSIPAASHYQFLLPYGLFHPPLFSV